MPYGKFTQKASSMRRKNFLGGVVQRRQKAIKTGRLRLAPPVAKLVDRRINKKLEQKTNSRHNNRRQLDNIPTDSGRVQFIVPAIEQGDDRQQRIGTQVKLSRLIVKGMLSIPADDNPTLGNGDRADICVRLMALSSKRFSTVEDVRDNWTVGANLLNGLFKNGANPIPPGGTLLDMWRDVNTESFTVHYDKVYQMKRGFGDALSTPATGAVHMPAVSKRIYISLKCKNKILKFRDPSDDSSTNYNPFLLCMWAYTNGAAPSESAVPFIQSYCTVYYHDT